MRDEAEKALRQLREAAQDLGPEAMDATLTAIYIQSVSYTVVYLIFAVVCLTFMTVLGTQRRDLDPGGQVLLVMTAMIFLFCTLVFFSEAAWMGMVSPEAALAEKILSKF